MTRRIALVAAVTLTALVLLVAVLLALLRTPAGGELARRFVVARLDQTIAGRFQIGRLSYGGDRITLHNVRLYDPDGRLVAQAKRVQIVAPLPGLWGPTIQVHSVRVDSPRLTLVATPQGLNLARALRSRAVGTGEPGRGVVVREIAVTDGAVDFRDEARRVTFDELSLSGRVAHEPASDGTRLRLSLAARGVRPHRAPLTARLAASLRDAAARATVDLAFGDARAEVQLDRSQRRVTRLRWDATIDPALLRAFVPRSPLVASVDVDGEATEAEGDITLAVAARAAQATLSVRGHVQREPLGTSGMDVQARDVDLARLIENGPRTALALRASIAGSGTTLETVDGKATVELPPGRLAGRPFGPVTAQLTATREEGVRARVDGRLPGLALAGSGHVAPDRVEASVWLRVSDLAVAARSLEGPDRRLPSLAGRGSLQIAVNGPPRAPAVTARARVPLLRIEETVLEGLALAVRMPSVRAPQLGTARLDLRHGRAGRLTVGDLTATVATRAGRHFTARIGARSGTPLAFTARGTWGPDQRRLAVAEATVTLPDATWHLEGPAGLAFPPGAFEIDSLRLASGAQRIALDLGRRDDRVRGRLGLRALDLARLPRFVLPAERALAGHLDGTITVDGELPRPEVQAELALRQGRYARFRDVALDLAARHAGGRVAGDLTVRAPEATAEASFDLPARWPPRPETPVRLKARAKAGDLARLLEALEHPAAKAIRGTGAFELALAGRAGDPRLDGRATAEALVVDGQKLGDLTLAFAHAPGAPLWAELRGHPLARALFVRVETPVRPLALIRRAADLDRLQRTPFALRATVDRLPLAPVAALAGLSGPIGGLLSAEVDLRGPARLLAGEARVDATGLALPRLPATDGHLRLQLRDEMAADLQLVRKGRLLARATAKLELPASRLGDRAALGRAPIAVSAHVGPLEVQRLDITPVGPREPPRALRGRVEAELELRGSLDDPRLRLRARADDARLGRAACGDGEVRLDHASGRSRVQLALVSANGGRLTADASAPVDLSWRALQRGLRLRQIPIAATLASRDLDLTFLSGIAEGVGTVAGRLDAQARLEGPLGAPHLSGRLAVRNGRVMLVGFGDLRDIRLALRGDSQRMMLERLSARSGAGTVHLSGEARRTPVGDGPLRLAVGARFDRFLVRTEGQPLGELSLRASVDGTLSPDALALRTRIDEAHFVLSDRRRRDLQPLERPADVILFRNGEPLNRTQARRYDRLLAAQGRAPDGAAAEPGTARTREVRLAVQGPRNLWLRGPDLNLELGVEPGFRAVLNDEPRVFGTVVVRRGHVEVLGRRFDLQPESSVRFVGPIEAPQLDVQAVYRVARDDSTVVARVTGTADDFAFTFRSPEHPEYGDAELVSLVITGRPPTERAGAAFDPGARAASLLGNVLASQLERALTARLPLDVLTIDPGRGEGTVTRFEAGTYIGTDLYVAYVGRLGADPFLRENRNELHLEYQITSRWSVEAAYGDARRGSADLIWKRTY